jgi:hypothetical protein
MEERSMTSRPARRASGWQWLILAIGLASCATVDATSTQYVGAPSFPPTDPASVQILRVEPAMPHVRLGEIQIDGSTDPAPSVEQIEEKLRADGAKMGANAVVIVLDRLQPVGAYVAGPWWGRSIEQITGRKVVGVAIRYTRAGQG